MKTTKSRMTVNKGGNGGVTYRATLPVSWIREMGLGEDARNLKLEFDGEKITITNNEEEVAMLNNLLEKAKKEIEDEINKIGFIDDSDNNERFIDELVSRLLSAEEIEEDDLKDEVLEEITSHMKKTYKEKGSCNDRGDFTGCYYKSKKGLEKWNALGK